MKLSPSSGNYVLERMTNVSVKVYEPILNCLSAVAMSFSIVTFALSILNGGCEYSLKMQFSVLLRIIVSSDNDMAFMYAPESTSPSRVISPSSSSR